MLFEHYGSVPEILKAFVNTIKGKKQLEIEKKMEMMEDHARRGAMKELEIENFQFDKELAMGNYNSKEND